MGSRFTTVAVLTGGIHGVKKTLTNIHKPNPPHCKRTQTLHRAGPVPIRHNDHRAPKILTQPLFVLVEVTGGVPTLLEGPPL